MNELLIIANNHDSDHFLHFEEKCKLEFNKPVSTMTELKAKNSKKKRGDIFELFAQKYFKYVYSWYYRSKKYTGLEEVWLLNETPDEVLEELALKRQDLGIDLIGKDSKDRYYAIQVKFRTMNRYKETTGVGWKQLSTFYALVAKTGPWYKHVVFTNAHYCRHVGKKGEKDQSVCRARLMKLTRFDFINMSGIEGRRCDSDDGDDDNNGDKLSEDKLSEDKLSEDKLSNKKLSKKEKQEPDLEELRRKRLERFG